MTTASCANDAEPLPDLAACPQDPGSDNMAPVVLALHSPIDIAPETIKHAANVLFVLWLKVAATLVAVWLLTKIWQIVVLAIFTLMLVATLNPLVRRLQKRFTRAKSIAVVVFSMLGTVGALLVLMIPPLVTQARKLLVNLPHDLSLIENATHRMGVKLNLHGSSLDLTQHAASLGEAFDALVTIFSGIAAVLTVAVLTTYLLIDGPSVHRVRLGCCRATSDCR